MAAGPAVKLVGENQIVYASDFPHWDNSYPQSIDEIRERGDLSDAQKRRSSATTRGASTG